MRLFLIALTAVLALGNINFSQASVVKVSPTHLYLSQEQPINVLRITNPNEQPMLFQLQLVRWEQLQGKDNYVETHDILATPVIFHLKAQQTQLIRFAYKGKFDNSDQKTYRVVLKEVLPDKTLNVANRLRVALNVSLPIFVQPQTFHESFAWSSHWIDKNHVKLELLNQGNVTLFTNEIQIKTNADTAVSKKERVFAYIMPKKNNTWIIEASKNTNLLYIYASINGHSTITKAENV